MQIVNSKFKESLVFFALSIVLAISLPVCFNHWQLCIIGIFIGSFFAYKSYELYKTMKDNSFYTVDVICTSKKNDWINFGNAKIYEFEPVDNEKYKDVIILNIFNDEFSLSRKKHSIKENRSYELVFKKNKNGPDIPNQETFIGLSRNVINRK